MLGVAGGSGSTRNSSGRQAHHRHEQWPLHPKGAAPNRDRCDSPSRRHGAQPEREPRRWGCRDLMNGLDGRRQEVGQDLGAQHPLFHLIHQALRAGEVERSLRTALAASYGSLCFGYTIYTIPRRTMSRMCRSRVHHVMRRAGVPRGSGPSSCLIHRSALKRGSPKFAAYDSEGPDLYVPARLPEVCKVSLGGGLYVLVEAEKVGWVVLILQVHKSLVVLAEGLAYQPISLLEEAGEVQVRAAAGEAPHVGRALSRPGY